MTPTRVTSCAATVDQTIAVPATARYATPVCIGEKPEHLLHVERQHQEHREQRGAQDEAGHVRAGDRPRPQDAEAHQRLGLAELPGDEADEQRQRAPKKPTVRAASQPSCPACVIA